MSELEKRILETIWEEEPVSVPELSKKMGLSDAQTNIQLHVMRRAKLVSITPEGYIITEDGKNLIGFPKIDRVKAQEILRKTPPENVFYFYRDVDQPLDISSDNLMDFYEAVKLIDIKSIEFHTFRRDFESWINFLGDVELEKKIELIRKANLTGEDLREKLYTTLKARIDELLKKVAVSC